MSVELQTSSYIVASILFILSLGGLSNEEKAKRAVWFGIFGMAIAIIGTIFGPNTLHNNWLLPSLIIAIFSLVLFNVGLQKYFDSKIKTAVNNSAEVAKNYLEQTRNSIIPLR